MRGLQCRPPLRFRDFGIRDLIVVAERIKADDDMFFSENAELVLILKKLN